MSARRNEKETVIDIFNRRADERIEKKQTEKQLVSIIEEKNTQLAVLNHVNTRLGAELVILQKKLGIDHGIILRELEQINQISAAFHCETDQMVYLDALLTAYDENNLNQKKIIAHLYSSLEDAEKNAQNLVKDNDFLMVELQEKTKQILQIYSKGFVDDNLVSSYNKLERENYIEMMENLRDQNEYLLTNFRKLEDKHERALDELKECKSKSDHYFELYKKQSEDLKQCMIKIDDLLKIKDVLEKKFDEITQENLELETTKENLEAKIVRLEAERNDFRNKLNTQRTVQYEQTERISQDFEALRLEHEASEKREREFFNKNMMLQKDLQSFKEDYKILKRDLEKTKSDFQQTLKMCEAYENKINIFNKKQVIMKETMEDHKQKLESTLLQRDKAIMKQKQLEKIIETIKQRNKDQMEALKSTFQKLILEQNQKIRVLEEDKQDSNSVFYQNQCSLKHQIDKLKRENQILKQENFRHIENVKSNTGSEIISKLRDLQEKNQTLSRLITQKQRSYREDIDHKDEMIRSLENENRQLSRCVDRERTEAREAINERTHLKSRISILENEKQSVEEQIRKLKRAIDLKASASSEEKQQKIRQLEQKVAEMARKQRETRERTIQLLQKYNEAEEEIKLEYGNKISALEAQNNMLKKKLNKK